MFRSIPGICVTSRRLVQPNVYLYPSTRIPGTVEVGHRWGDGAPAMLGTSTFPVFVDGTRVISYTWYLVPGTCYLIV